MMLLDCYLIKKNPFPIFSTIVLTRRSRHMLILEVNELLAHGIQGLE